MTPDAHARRTHARADLDGLGFFYASADMRSLPYNAADKCLQAGASWAAVLAESVDGRKQTPAKVAAHADALRARGVLPIVYTFPGPQICRTPELLQAAIRRAIERANAAGCGHVCLDFEPFAGYDWGSEQITDAIAQVHAADLSASVTVFSRPRWDRPAFREALTGAPLILQVYERARAVGSLRDALTAWPGDTVPAIGTYLGDVSRLINDLDNVNRVRPPCPGFPRSLAIWALATTDRVERRALLGWSGRVMHGG